MEVIIMKVVTNILKVLAVLAAIVGVIYVAATYGEQIVAWARRLLERFRGKGCCIFEDECFEDAVRADEADFEA